MGLDKLLNCPKYQASKLD